MRPKQERRPTAHVVRDPEGARPRMGRVMKEQERRPTCQRLARRVVAQEVLP